MDFVEYQIKANKTAQYPKEIYLCENRNGKIVPIAQLPWVYPALGLAAEIGEVMNQLKKVIRDDKGVITEERMVDVKDEIGDSKWYLDGELCTSLGLESNEISVNNLAKLQLRLRNNQIHGDKR